MALNAIEYREISFIKKGKEVRRTQKFYLEKKYGLIYNRYMNIYNKIYTI